jgi:hypothetical protein
LPFLFLTRGRSVPSHTTLCEFRRQQAELLEQVWVHLFQVAQELGVRRLGHLVVDSSKLRANASPEAVVEASEFEVLRQEFQALLAEAEARDEQEAEEGTPETRTGQSTCQEQVREILRRVRRAQAQRRRGKKPRQEAPRPLGPQMKPRLREGLAALEAAQEQGAKHLCLTDPDSRMMPEGRERKVRQCHSFEVAVDREAGLLVVAQSSQSAQDNSRLEGLVEAAKAQEPEGVKAVDGDSGYYQGAAVGRLLEQGIDVCVPDSQLAADLHRGLPLGTHRQQHRSSVPLVYEEAEDQYRCPQGKVLPFRSERQEAAGKVRIYKTRESCEGCPLAPECLTRGHGRHRQAERRQYEESLEAQRQRFEGEEYQERYRHRGEWVERVFGFLRANLGYTRWLLRGKEGVACESRLFSLAYQLRKLYGTWRRSRNRPARLSLSATG